MPKYKVSQRFNNGVAKNYSAIETDAITMQSIIDLMPHGVAIFQPSIAPAVGSKVPMPTAYKQITASCFKVNDDGSYQSTLVNIPIVKSVKTDTDVVTALLGQVDVPDGTLSQKVNIKKYKTVGA